ncbi:MAG: carbon-nitrogen hydrolase family protein [Halioglobus sp.]
MKARVAALQFASGTDLEQNLATCLRVIDLAGEQAVQLMVLPEFSNHISWYDDAEHAWRVSLELKGAFLGAISDRAREHGCYIVVNVSLRRPDRTLTVSSLCYDPRGQLAGVADKQTLMGHENIWFTRAQKVSDIVQTPFGRLGMFPCRDGVTCETPRGLALRGAQLFCDSLNSFALDEASLHVPARAPENKVFLVAANKIGPLIPAHLLTAVSAETHIPLRFLNGAGESQIVSPEGEVLARGPGDEEAVVCAEIDLQLADDKLRPDGTDLFLARRPRLYRPVAQAPEARVCTEAADAIGVALLLPEATDEAALGELTMLVEQLPKETVLAVLPELFCYGDTGALPAPLEAGLAERAINAMVVACSGRKLMLCASLVMSVGAGYGLVSVLIDSSGVRARQPQLHRCERYPWMVAGDALSMVDLPWGKLAIITGDDTVFPELLKVAALRGAHVIAAPLQLQEPWEEAFGLRSRAAENRVCLIASSRPLNQRGGLIADLEGEFTLMTQWQKRRFDGYINRPVVTEQGAEPGVVYTEIHPNAACNKLMSEHTDLLLDRPWQLSEGLLVDAEEFDHA